MRITKEELETIVRQNEPKVHEIRQAIENFRITVLSRVLGGKAVLGELYPTFKSMNSCLHRKCNDETAVDLSALVYSLQRLPNEIRTANRIYIQKEPENLNSVQGIKRLYSPFRKRAMYDLGDGELKFIAREAETENLDYASCLIMYGIEAGKIKRLLGGRRLVEDLEGAKSPEKRNQVLARVCNVLGVRFDDMVKAEKAIGYGFNKLAKDVMTHNPAEMTLEFDPNFAKTDASEKARKWRERIGKEMAQFDNRPMAIISSDNHSVLNCVSGFAETNRERIIELAKRDPELSKIDTNDPSMLYHVIRGLCSKPEYKRILDAKIAFERKMGIRIIKDVNETGVDVHVIDLARILSEHPEYIDPRIRPSEAERKKVIDRGLLILNMDYSFGRQGVHNMGELCGSFGSRIESISITGKAGIIRPQENGERFDIMLPSYAVYQITGGFYDFPTGNSLQKKDLQGILTRGKIHDNGPMLTVPGTAMQSDLLFYYHLVRDGIIGTEMEAGPYLHSITKAYRRKNLRKDLVLNVGYWASDNPLDPNETLAESHMERGCIPSYALVLATLRKIMNH